MLCREVKISGSDADDESVSDKENIEMNDHTTSSLTESSDNVGIDQDVPMINKHAGTDFQDECNVGIDSNNEEITLPYLDHLDNERSSDDEDNFNDISSCNNEGTFSVNDKNKENTDKESNSFY